MKAAEKAVLGILQTSFELLKGSSRNNFHVFIKHKLAKKAHNKALGNSLDQNTERSTQPSVLRDIFTHRAQISFWSVRPVAKITSENRRNNSI